jgi:hypothetical protein
VKRNQGCKLYILIFYISTLLASFDLKADDTNASIEKSNSTNNAIEEGWVEKKIAPPTQWVESIFAPFTQWMESEIQQDPVTQTTPFTNNSSHQLISVRRAIELVLEKNPGKILRSQFKTGPPPYYKIKILSDKGTVAVFNVHAFSGELFTPSTSPINTHEAKQ